MNYRNKKGEYRKETWTDIAGIIARRSAFLTAVAFFLIVGTTYVVYTPIIDASNAEVVENLPLVVDTRDELGKLMDDQEKWIRADEKLQARIVEIEKELLEVQKDRLKTLKKKCLAVQNLNLYQNVKSEVECDPKK